MDGTGTAFADQGGHANGCGIPSAASAIQATVTSVAASASGFMKAYPAGTSAPGATFLNYAKPNSVGDSGSITLCGATCGSDINISNYGASTNVVIDVQGYYVKPLWAFVEGDDTSGANILRNNSRAVRVERLNSPGLYVVHFDRVTC